MYQTMVRFLLHLNNHSKVMYLLI